MKRIYTISFILFIFLFSFALNINARADQGEKIQLALLLDTSSSMDGLIDQAKSRLWKVVNEMSLAKKHGKSPQLEVALYEYGNDGLAAGENYIKMVVPFTKDLDRISEELFKLTTNGGSEFCGAVISSALKELQWSNSRGALKTIFIAGNEPFSQGSIDYKKACQKAASKGIMVNTIFCGNYQQGINSFWKDGADRTNGRYMNIDQNRKMVYIPAPQDKEIAKLGRELNKTYIAYGRGGSEKKERQKKQDMNAAGMSEEALIQRTVAKASKQYINTGWDLADAVENKTIDLDDMKTTDLPPEMKKMTKAERKSHVNKMIARRKAIQKKLNDLNRERRKYIDSEMKKRADKNTLDRVMVDTVRKQAMDKEFLFE